MHCVFGKHLLIDFDKSIYNAELFEFNLYLFHIFSLLNYQMSTNLRITPCNKGVYE